MVINVKLSDEKSGINYPVCEMVTDCHTTYNIQLWLEFFKNEIMKSSNSGLFFKNVISDMSKANLNAICLAWNKCDLLNYINKIYDDLNHNSENEFIFIHLCYAHFKKTFERFISKNFSKKTEIIKKLITIFDNIVHEINYDATKEKIVNLFMLCTTIDKDESNIYFNKLLNKIVVEHVVNDETEFFEDNKVEEDKTNYEKNKFFKEYQKIKKTIQDSH